MVTEKPTSLVEIEQQAITIRQEMTAIEIVDQATYNIAVEKRTEAANWLKDAEAFFDPSIKDAHDLHKKLLAQKRLVCEPTESAIKQINRALLSWDQAQERLRREEQSRLEEIALREAEEQRLADAIQMEADGVDAETVDAVISAPVEVHMPAIAAPTYQKSNQVQYRDNWGAECYDLFALVKAVAKDRSKIGLLMVNQPALNQMAKALKETMSIPGCRSVNNKVVATGRG